MGTREDAVSTTDIQGEGSSEYMARVTVSPDHSVSAVDDAERVKPLTEPLEKCYAKDLRREVYRLKLVIKRKGPDGNDHKRGYIELLRAHWREAPAEADLPSEQDDAEALTTSETPALEPQESPGSRPDESPDTPSDGEERSASPSPRHVLIDSSDVEEDVATSGTTAAEEFEEIEADLSLFEEKAAGNDASESASSVVTYDSGGSFGDNAIAHSDAVEDADPLEVPIIGSQEAPGSTGEGGAAQPHAASNLTLCAVYVSEASAHEFHSLETSMRHTQYWEQRLTVSKRRINELLDELQDPCAQDEANLLKDELAYYTRERKRALKSLLSDRSSK